MAKKNSKITKQKFDKLLKAAAEISSFSAMQKGGNTIYLDDIYQLKSNSDDIVVFSLLFYNIGVATTTSAYLENKTVLPGEIGSVNDFPVGRNSNLGTKTLSIKSSIVTTELSSPFLPADFRATLVIRGGKSTVKYDIENQITLEEVGQNLFLNILIFFF